MDDGWCVYAIGRTFESDESEENDWTEEGCQYPTVKEGVVIRRSTIMKGQRMPKVKVKTKWWLTELHNKFTEEECKLLE